ncbi:MAG: J domain-containing protein [Cyanobacteriota bacterium]|jgi:curved DNA-binding protein CbpA|nr:J domain-containing protein [Cyanobacteriota bacterium]
MSYLAFSPDWLNQFSSDPYAILGVSVAADERRILTRYRSVAKRLHPDAQFSAPAPQQEFVGQVLSKLVNPAYQRLKQEKGRSEILATLRFKVRRLTREQDLEPQTVAGQRLLSIVETEVDLVYEDQLGQLCQAQYDSSEAFELYTSQIAELNLIYLRRKMGTVVMREKRTGLMATGMATTPPSMATETSSTNPHLSISYADRHFKRAQEYLRTKNITAALQELKDAIKLDPKNSNYHCLIGQVYLLANLPGMAKVHLKQALRLEPTHSIALKYAQQLNLDLSFLTTDTNSASQSPSTPAQHRKNGLFGGIFSRH